MRYLDHAEEHEVIVNKIGDAEDDALVSQQQFANDAALSVRNRWFIIVGSVGAVGLLGWILYLSRRK